ncbi:MAG TPA: polysaccharide biosynthesis/export family protein [Chthoniobacteraceae bacterium]|nr:polysaccharide biosynthesis/export family protein [Chthoniobacteraceae bacterium]
MKRRARGIYKQALSSLRICLPCLAVVLSFGLTVHGVAQTVKRATTARAPQFSRDVTFAPGDCFAMSLGSVPAGDARNFEKIYTIGGDGTINVPFAGIVRAAGLTQSQLEKVIEQKLIDERIYRWPTITITAPERPRLIKVGGVMRAPQRTYWPLELEIHLHHQPRGKSLPIDEMKRRANCAMINP